MSLERMFLSIPLPAEVIDIVSDLPTRPLRGVSFTKRKQWHVTMRYLGDCERDQALGALETLQAPAASVTLGPQVSLLGTRIVMLPANGLDATAAAVNQAFANVGDPVDREFFGHLTIARLKGGPLRNPSLVSVIDEPISATWHADTIDLWKSEVTQDGAEHTLVATQNLT